MTRVAEQTVGVPRRTEPANGTEGRARERERENLQQRSEAKRPFDFARVRSKPRAACSELVGSPEVRTRRSNPVRRAKR